jgi:apolipoprotein N-acyltransferase
MSNEAEAGTLKVAAVQGNAKAGLLVVQPRGTILRNHLDASESLRTASDKPDLVIWPENAADSSPLANVDSKWLIEDFVSHVGAPLMLGTITQRGDEIFNSSLLWQPKLGPTDWYDKKRPVAFGEYVPDRAFWRMLAPELIDLIPRGYSFGTRDGIFELPSTKVGTMICFEVAVDDISRDLVHSGATLLIAQTNNSDFGRTNESAQQLAIARLRAIETGRVFVNISTVGTSAIIYPNGTVSQQLPTYQAAMMQEELPLRTSITPAMAIGGSLEIANNFSALAQIAFVVFMRFRGRRVKASE